MSDVNIGPITDESLVQQSTAIENLNVSDNTGVDVEVIADTKADVKLSGLAPKEASLGVANTMLESRMIASAITPDAPKLSDAERLGRTTRLTTQGSDVSRERSKLALEVMDFKALNPDKPVPDDLDLPLIAYRKEAKRIGNELSQVDPGLASQGAAAMYSSFRDTFISAMENPGKVLGGTAAGAGLGGFFGTITVPLIGTFTGAAGGAATGLVTSTMAVSAYDNINRMRGETYDELSIATLNNKPINMSEESKRNISNAVGILGGSVEYGLEKFGLSKIPGLRGLFHPGTIAEKLAKNPRLRDTLIDFGKGVAANMVGEGTVEGVQYNLDLLAKELGNSWDGSETSVIKALGEVSRKATSSKQAVDSATGQPIVNKQGKPVSEAGQYFSNLGQQVAVGAIAGGTGATVLGVPGSIHERVQVKIKENQKYKSEKARALETVETMESGSDNGASGAIPVAEPVTPETTKIVTEDGKAKYLNSQQSLTLALILRNTTDAVKESKVEGNLSTAVELQKNMLKESGVNNGWVDMRDMVKWADTEKKRSKLQAWFGTYDADINGRVAVDLEILSQMTQEDPDLSKVVRPDVDGMSFEELTTYYKDRPDRINRDFVALGVQPSQVPTEIAAEGVPVPLEPQQMELTEQPVTAQLGPSSTDEEILATIGTKQEANAYLGRLQDEESRLINPNKVDLEIEKVTRKITELESLKTTDDLIGYVKNLGDSGASLVKTYSDTLNDIDKLKSGAPFSELETVKGRLESVDDVKDFDRYMSEEDRTSRTDPQFKKPSGTVPLNNKKIRSELIKTLQNNVDQDVKTMEDFRTQAFQGMTTGLGLKKAVVEGLKNQRPTAIQAMRERVTTLAETLPDQEPDLDSSNDLTLDEDVEIALQDFATRPIYTDLIRAGVAPSVVRVLEGEYAKLRQEIIEATRETAYAEMIETANITDEQIKTDEAIDAIDTSLSDPNIERVTIYKDNLAIQGVEMQVSIDSLSAAQQNRYLEDPVLKRIGMFSKYGKLNLNEFAVQFGVPDGETALNILMTTPDIDQAFKNAKALTETAIDTEVLDSTDFNNTAIIKALDNKQKLDEQTFKLLVESAWSKARRGVEGTVFAKIDMDKIKQETALMIEAIPLGKLNPQVYLRSSKRAAIKKVKSALRGDFLESARQREIEIRADEAYKQALVTKAKSNRMVKKLARWSRSRAIIQTLKDSRMLEAYKELGKIINLDPKAKVKNGAFAKLVEQFKSDQTVDMSIPQELIAELNPAATPDELSFSQLAFVYNKHAEVLTQARNDQAIQVEQEKLYIAEVAPQFNNELKDHPERDLTKTVRDNQVTANAAKRLSAMLRSVALYMPNINYITMRLAQGKENSFIRKFIYDQLKGTGSYDNGYGEKATSKARVQLKKAITSLQKLNNRRKRIQGYAKDLIAPAQFKDSQGLVDGRGMMTKLQLMTSILFYGSQTGRQRLENFNVNPDTFLEVADQYLTEDDMDFVQSIWNLHDTYKGAIKRMVEEIRGHEVEFIEPAGFTFKGKQYKGGYVPLKYRKSATLKEGIQQSEQETRVALGQEKEIPLDIESSEAFTKQGNLVSRVKNYQGQLNLDWNYIVAGGFEDVIVQTTMHVPILNIMRALKDEGVSTDMAAVLGLDAYQEMKNHIIGAGRSHITEQLELNSELASNFKVALSAPIQNFVKNTLIAVPSTVILQLQSGVYAWHSQGVGSTPKYLWVVAKLLARPHLLDQAIILASELDPSIGSYIDNVNEDGRGGIARDVAKDLYIGSSKLGRLDEKFIDLLRATDSIMTTVFLDGLLGTIDMALKVPAVITMYENFKNGKVKGYGKDVLLKMSSQEVENEARSYATRMSQATLTASSNIEKAKAQKVEFLRHWSRYFNDMRNLYNYSMFTTVQKTRWSLNAARKDVSNGNYFDAAMKVSGTAYNLIAFQMYATVAATIVSAARGKGTDEDDEEVEFETAFTHEWEKQIVQDALNSFMNPLLVPKNAISALPIIREFSFSLTVREGTEDRVRPIIGGMDIGVLNNQADMLRALQVMWENDGDVSDKQWKAILKGGASWLPIPYRAIDQFNNADPFADKLQDINKDPAYVLALPMVPLMIAKALMDRFQAQGNVQAYQEVEKIKEVLDPNNVSAVVDYAERTKVPLTDYEKNIIMFTESNGDPNAQAPGSSAFGLYQFTRGTWNAIADKYSNLGLTREGWKTSPEQQELAFRLLTNENARALTRAGIEVNVESLYAAHHFEITKLISILRKPDVGLLPDMDDERDANPWLNGGVSTVNQGNYVRTVGQFKQSLRDLLEKGKKKYVRSLNLTLD